MQIRAVTTTPHTYRFAATAPYYFQDENGPCIRASACRFFQGWIIERIQRLKDKGIDDRDEVVQWQRKALRFWQAREAMATAM